MYQKQTHHLEPESSLSSLLILSLYRTANPFVVMAQAEQKTSYEKVKAAASTFAAYLEANALPVHYIQVRLPDYPIRRVDHETGLSPYRKDQVKSIFTWSEAQRRWTRKDGGILVAETEIWQVVQYFIKATVQVSAIELCNTIDERVEGIYHGDVDKVWRLWKNSGLSRAEFSQNAQWIGRKPLKLSGKALHPIMPFIHGVKLTLSQDHMDDLHQLQG